MKGFEQATTPMQLQSQRDASVDDDRAWLRKFADASLPPHVTEGAAELLDYLDEYEANREGETLTAEVITDLAAFRIAECFKLIRVAILRVPK